MGFTAIPLTLIGSSIPASPSGIVFSEDGKILYIADRETHVIWRVDLAAGGVCTVLAGQHGKRGYSDGKSNEATFSSPGDIVIDREGYVVVCDQGNLRLRRVSTVDGSVTTLAGSGQGDECVDGVGTAVSFRGLSGICMDDQGFLFVTDKHCVRRVELNGTVTNISGHMKHRGFADGRKGDYVSFNYPDGICYHEQQIFVCDSQNCCIRRIAGIHGGASTTTLGGCGVQGSADGWREYAEFHEPASLCPSADGVMLYIADAGNSAIRQLTYDGHSMTATLSGVKLPTPRCIRTDPRHPGNLLVIDATLKKIFVLEANTDAPRRGELKVILPEAKTDEKNVVTGYHVTTILGKGRGRWAENDYAGGNHKGVQLEMPTGVAIAPGDDRLYIADTGHHCIIMVTKDGIATTIAGNGSPGFADGAAPDAMFDRPEFITLDTNGDVLVADLNNNRIRRVSSDGFVSTYVGCESAAIARDGAVSQATLSAPHGVMIDKRDGSVYIAESCRIRRVTPYSPTVESTVTTVCGTTPGFAEGNALTQAQMKKPHCCVTAPDGTMYISDTQNHRIRRMAPDGTVTTLAGSVKGFCDGIKQAARFNRPLGLLYMGDHLLVCDINNFRIRKVTLDGIVTTICGNGKRDMADGGVDDASFMGPGAIATDGSGRIWVTDLYAHCIRLLTPIIDGVDTLAEEKKKMEVKSPAAPVSSRGPNSASAHAIRGGRAAAKAAKAAAQAATAAVATAHVPSSSSSSSPTSSTASSSTTTTTTATTAPTTASSNAVSSSSTKKHHFGLVVGILAVATIVGIVVSRNKK